MPFKRFGFIRNSRRRLHLPTQTTSKPQANGQVTQTALQSETYSIGASWSDFRRIRHTRGQNLGLGYQAPLRAPVEDLCRYNGRYHQLPETSGGFSSRSMVIAERNGVLLADQVKRLNEDLKLGYASQSTRSIRVSRPPIPPNQTW